MKCPYCSRDIIVATAIPDTQRMTIHLETEQEMFSLQIIGGVLANTDELLKSVAREVGGNVHVFIESIDLQPRDIRVTVVVLPAPPLVSEPTKDDGSLRATRAG